MEPAPSIVEAISDSLTGESARVVKVRAVEIPVERRNSRGWPTLMVAAEIVDEGASLEAVFATGSLGGPITAVNSVAREYTDWGAAARGDSRAGAMRDMLAGYPEAESVLRVLRGT